jgi:transposase
MGYSIGIDLHSNNAVLGVLDQHAQRVFSKKLPNDLDIILKTLAPFQSPQSGVVVESTFNWYWLVDGLREHGYTVHLANPVASRQKYSGLKYTDDKDDAYWLAQLLKLDILPTGYIMPKEERAIRDLLRKRWHLVKLRNSMILSLQNIVSRNTGHSVSGARIKEEAFENIAPPAFVNQHIQLAGQASKETIDFLSIQIDRLETVILRSLTPNTHYHRLKTTPGVGVIIAWTILLETGPIDRFPSPGHYASYCRKVGSARISNNKKKGVGNTKNGNRYLAWAFSEAAVFARRYYPECQKFYDNKLRKRNEPVAHNALAHKLCRAAYHILKDGTEFDMNRLFHQPVAEKATSQ